MNISEFLIDENISMLEAMSCLDKVAKKILFVLKDERFVATITDGDIRRWILKKGNLVAKVKDIANYNPRFIYEKDKNTAKTFMEENGIPAVPIVDENRNIISIIFQSVDKEAEVFKNFCLFACQKRVKFFENSVLL